jgi:hypothetical protein
MKLKNTFLQGIMDKDTDERLVPKGKYRHAENIQVGNSQGSDVGAIENVVGNVKLTSFDLTNAKCIGELEDGKSRKIYYFITSDEKDLVVEFDEEFSTFLVLLESLYQPDSLLNFNKDYLITGVNKIINGDSDLDLLAWTDDLNPPRIINIERAKGYTVDGFTEEDISVIKKPPRYAPTTTLQQSVNLENYLEDKFISYSYRYKYLDGEYSALSSFSRYQFFPSKFDLDYQTSENKGMKNLFNQVLIEFDTGSKRVTDVQLVFRESNSSSVYIIETLNKEDEGWFDNEEKSYLFNNSKKYEQLPIDELTRLFDNVPLQAKSQEFIGNRLCYGNYKEGYDMVDVNDVKIAMDYDLNLLSQDIAYKSLNYQLAGENIVYDKLIVDFSNTPLIKGNVISFSINMTSENDDASFLYNYSYLLPESFANVSLMSTSDDFIYFVGTIMSTIFNQNVVDVEPPNATNTTYSPFTIGVGTANELVLIAPYITYEIDNGSSADEIHYWNHTDLATDVSVSSGQGSRSLKSNRSYEVGIVYMDSNNRSSTVLTDSTNTILVPHDLATSQNKIEVEINHNPPKWADRYKFVIKQNKGDYETVYVSSFYEDGLYRWVKLEGTNKNKVKEGDVLVLKSDLNGAVTELIEVKVLEVTQKESNFIDGNTDGNDNDITEPAGLYMKIKPVGFAMDSSDAITQEYYDYDYPSSASGYAYLNMGNRNPLSNPDSLGGYWDANTSAFIDYPILAGTRIHMDFWIGEGLGTGTSHTYDKDFIVQENYTKFEDWYNSEVVNLGFDFESLLEDTVDRFDRGGTLNDLTMQLNENIGNAEMRGNIQIVYSGGDLIFETKPPDIEDEVFYETGLTFDITNDLHVGNTQDQTVGLPAICELDAFNCYTQSNGAESFKYQDSFNVASLQMNLRPNAVDLNGYKEVRRYADMTYSEPFNENNSINGLNEFNLSRANYKEDIEKKYGSIQKMYSRDTDIVIFQEDKVSKVLFGKDLLYNADSSTNLSVVDDVLGQVVAYSGEWGISRNPESFAFDANNLYWTDVKRGAILRLGAQGITEISAYGLRTWTKDRFNENLNGVKLGAFDPYYDQYVLHIDNEDTEYDSYTLTFDEKFNGWTSFHSYFPEQMTGVNNKFFTVKNGDIYQHHIGSRNVFYDRLYPSKVKFIFNDEPSDIKAFKSLNLEGTHSWNVDLKTNFTDGHLTESEFVKKESEWYAYIRRSEDTQDYSTLATQGLGFLQSEADSLTLELINVPSSVSNGDSIYVLQGSGDIVYVGLIESHDETTVTLDSINTTVNQGDFIVFSKDSRSEGSMIRGYFMEVEMSIDTTEDVELFCVNTEVFKSYE